MDRDDYDSYDDIYLDDDDDDFDDDSDAKENHKPSDDEGHSKKQQEESFWERTLGRRIDGIIPDALKKAVAGSLGAIFLSEEKLRQQLSDLKMPKELIHYVLEQADHTKKDILKLVAREFRDFLETTNFYEELQKILTTLSFEIRTEIRLIPNDHAVVKPEIKNQVRVKTSHDDPEPFTTPTSPAPEEEEPEKKE